MITSSDGRRWATIEGRATIRTDAASMADAEHRYATRYKPPRPNPGRMVIEITATQALGDL